MDLDTLLTAEDGFGQTSSTFLQRAINRIFDGAPLDDLLARGTDFDRRCLEAAIGCPASHLPIGVPPTEVVDMEPPRCGKSLRLAALGFARSQTIDVSILKPGEQGPRISILATELDQAAAIRGHLQMVHEKPMLRSLLVGEDADGVFLRHPSGLVIELRVIAAKRGGYSLASRWSGSVIFDEAPGWYSTDKIISLEESRDQALVRLLPGAQAAYVGSKWQPSGFCFNAHRDHFGRPTAEMVVISPQEVTP